MCSPEKIINPWNTVEKGTFEDQPIALVRSECPCTAVSRGNPPPGTDCRSCRSSHLEHNAGMGTFHSQRGLWPTLHKKPQGVERQFRPSSLWWLLNHPRNPAFFFAEADDEAANFITAFFKVLFSILLPLIYACSWASVMLSSSAFCCWQLFLAWCHVRADSGFIW